MSKQLKSDKMEQTKTVAIYKNEDAANYEMTELNKVVNEVKAVKQYLVESDALLSAVTIQQACNRKFDAIVENFIESEKAKLKDFEDKFGVLSLLTGNSDERLQLEADKLRAKLLAGLPKIHYQSHYYFDFIDFETLEVKQGINKAFFVDKHSIKVDAEAAKHQINLVNALNYFYAIFPDYNTQVVFNLIAKVDSFERKAEVNLDAFDYRKNVRDFVSNRMNEPDYRY